MIKRFNPITNPIFSTVIDTVDATLRCPKFFHLTDRIGISLPDCIGLTPDNRELIERGFGSCVFKDHGYGVCEVIIVINMKNCVKANLTEREIIAVIYHELGHILNEPELEPIPALKDNFSYKINFKELLDKVITANDLKMEVYADSYANKHGYGEELISTFYKQGEHFEQKIGFSEIRVKEIQSNRYLKGKIAASLGVFWQIDNNQLFK